MVITSYPSVVDVVGGFPVNKKRVLVHIYDEVLNVWRNVVNQGVDNKDSAFAYFCLLLSLEWIIDLGEYICNIYISYLPINELEELNEEITQSSLKVFSLTTVWVRIRGKWESCQWLGVSRWFSPLFFASCLSPLPRFESSEKVANDLGLGDGFHRVLRFPQTLITG